MLIRCDNTTKNRHHSRHTGFYLHYILARAELHFISFQFLLSGLFRFRPYHKRHIAGIQASDRG